MGKKSISIFIVLVAMLVSFFSANQAIAVSTLTNDSFNKKQTEQIKKLKDRIAILNKELTCTQAAKTFEEMQKCRDESKKELKNLRVD